MLTDPDGCYRALCSRDARFDGWFFVGVTSTGIYCRPSCPAVPPRRDRVRFYPTAAAAQHAGFRACKRCRPDATPGSPAWNVRGDLVARAMRLIADGTVERDGVAGLASRLHVSERHLHRLLTAEVGAGAQALARAQRAQTARTLVETTELPFAQVAFAAGFASIRQFNDTVRAVFATTPTALRAAARGRAAITEGARAPGELVLRLPYRQPGGVEDVLAFLGARAVPGVESWDGTTYRRALRLPHGTGTVALRAGPGHALAALRLTDLRDLSTAVHRCRRLLDLDADPVAVTDVLGRDTLLAPLVSAAPGRRLPGHVEPAELAVRAVLGQQVSVGAARTHTAHLVAAAGEPLEHPDGGLTHLFPTPAAVADAVDVLGLPTARKRTLRTLAGALAAGDLVLDPGGDRDAARQALAALPGIGPWTASYVALRALGDPDVFLPTDLGVRRALTALGLDGAPAAAAARAEGWRPWRSYALVHLWGTLTPPAAPTTTGRTPTTREGKVAALTR